MTAQCIRCPTTLHRTTTHSLSDSIALTVAALAMLLVMSTTTLMGVETAGIARGVGRALRLNEGWPQWWSLSRWWRRSASSAARSTC